MAEYLNQEGYPDPTAYEAIKNIERQERKKKRVKQRKEKKERGYTEISKGFLR